MTFPSTANPTTSADSSSGTTLTVNLPASISAGDYLVVAVFCHPLVASVANITVPSGWTSLLANTAVGSDGKFAIFHKVASGSEGSSVSVTVMSSGNKDAAVALAYKVTGWGGALSNIDISTVATGSGSAPDPGSVTANGGSADNLFIEFVGAYDDDATFSAYSTNYTNGTEIQSGGGTNAGCELGSARRELAAASDDPGTLTLSESESWGASTIVIAPAAATGSGVLSAAGTGALSGTGASENAQAASMAGTGALSGVGESMAEAALDAAGISTSNFLSDQGAAVLSADGAATVAMVGASEAAADLTASGVATVSAVGDSTGGPLTEDGDFAIAGDSEALFLAESLAAAQISFEGITDVAFLGSADYNSSDWFEENVGTDGWVEEAVIADSWTPEGPPSNSWTEEPGL